MHDLQVRSVDAEDGGHAVGELANAIVLEELFNSPFETDGKHDCISWLNEQSAAWLDPELEEVLNSDIPVLSAVFTIWNLPGLCIIVPDGRFH